MASLIPGLLHLYFKGVPIADTFGIVGVSALVLVVQSDVLILKEILIKVDDVIQIIRRSAG